MHSFIVKTISRCSFGPIKLGDSRINVLGLLGKPEIWAEQDVVTHMDSSVWNYGPVQINFCCSTGRVEGLALHFTYAGAVSTISEALSEAEDCVSTEKTAEDLVNFLNQRNIEFVEKGSVSRLVITFGDFEMLFTRHLDFEQSKMLGRSIRGNHLVLKSIKLDKSKKSFVVC